MRIVVINTAASSGGALSILEDFYKYIRENDSSNEWVFFLSDYYIEETDKIKVEVIKTSKRKANRLKFDNFSGHYLINKYKPDVVFSMQNTTVARISVPQVLYLHQSIPFQNIKKYSFLKKDEFKYAIIQHLLGANIKYGLKRVDKVIVQTKWMKEAVISQTNIDSEKVEVIPPSVKINEEIKNKKVTYNYNRFFYPSASSPYKNNKLIKLACDYIENKYPELKFKVDITVDENFNSKHIQSIGKVSRRRVFEKMNREVLIFPSYIETYGLPLAEGRLVNSLILASDTPFSREVLKNYENAFFFNPFNEEELANLMIDSVRGKLIRKNQRDKLFLEDNTWEKVYRVLVHI